MRAIVAGLLIGVSGCATYDFEPVTPLALGQSIKVVDIGATPLKPNMFLVVDKSGSMKGPVDPTCVGAGCLSRLASMQQAMDSFLTTSGNIAHLGMVTFPSDALCGPGDLTLGVPLDVGDDDDARLAQSALVVKAQLDSLSPNGGTPTGATMGSLLSIDGLHSRDHSNYAVLLTDGAPNCNSANDAATCTCTDPTFQGHCAVGAANECFDDTGSASQIALLADKSIKTIVIGFGADVSGSAGATALQAMAAAGGFVRPCQMDSDCGAGDTCSPGGVDVCGRPASTSRPQLLPGGRRGAARRGDGVDSRVRHLPAVLSAAELAPVEFRVRQRADQWQRGSARRRYVDVHRQRDVSGCRVQRFDVRRADGVDSGRPGAHRDPLGAEPVAARGERASGTPAAARCPCGKHVLLCAVVIAAAPPAKLSLKSLMLYENGVGYFER